MGGGRSQKHSKEKNGCQFDESEWERKKEIDKSSPHDHIFLMSTKQFLIEKKKGEKTKVGSIERPKVVYTCGWK
jgi:hypothetical protein